MRTILAPAALLGIALSMPAGAQQAAPNPSWPWAHEPGTGQSGPASGQASNLGPADVHSDIAPHLPQPMQGENGGPNAYLHTAQDALARGQTGLAQQSLEMAETRLLDRSTLADRAGVPDQSPKVQAVHAALEALGRHDAAGANAAIQQALATLPPQPTMTNPASYAPYPAPTGQMPPPPRPRGYDQPSTPPTYAQ